MVEKLATRTVHSEEDGFSSDLLDSFRGSLCSADEAVLNILTQATRDLQNGEHFEWSKRAGKPARVWQRPTLDLGTAIPPKPVKIIEHITELPQTIYEVEFRTYDVAEMCATLSITSKGEIHQSGDYAPRTLERYRIHAGYFDPHGGSAGSVKFSVSSLLSSEQPLETVRNFLAALEKSESLKP